jgi:SPX domain protein involved in polyphosphate accumulation
MIEKIVLFLLEQQGMLASRIEKLAKQRAILQEQPDISGIAELREAYREVGLDLIKLLKFVDLNATGIRKILKKFDKRFGYRFTDYYVTSRSNHPYSQLQQVFKHVVMHWLWIFLLSLKHVVVHALLCCMNSSVCHSYWVSSQAHFNLLGIRRVCFINFTICNYAFPII